MPIGERGGYWYVRLHINGKTISRSTHLKATKANKPKAVAFLESFKKENEGLVQELKEGRKTYLKAVIRKSAYEDNRHWIEYIEGIKDDHSSWLYKLWQGARQRGRKRDVGFRISYELFVNIVKSTNGRCEATGIPFTFEKKQGQHRGPFQPSIDRVNSKLGYTRENCRITCLAVNLAMNQWGDEVLKRIGLSYLYRRFFMDFDKILGS